MTTLKGIFPNPKPTRRKNFIQENVKNLRRMEQFFHTKEADELQKLQLQKKPTDKYQNVTSRINSSFRGRKHDSLGKTILGRSDNNLADARSHPERKVSEPIENKNSEERKVHRNPVKLNLRDRSKKEDRIKTEKSKSFKRAPSDPDLIRETSNISDSHEKDYVKYRNQGIQTLDTDNVETLYKEGVIRYPSSRSSKNVSSPKRNTDGSPHRECPSSLSERDADPTSPQKENFDRTDLSPISVDQTDCTKFIKPNSSIANKIATQLSNGVLPSNYRKGVVPKYIRDRKEAQQQKEERMRAAASHPDCPEGHVPLPDDERKETLRMLKKRHQEFVSELNMMPIKTDTLRSQKRKMEIEKQLTKLEEGIKVFSRPKVYVKVNA